MIEIWKDVKGYEGLYKVSNKGNIKSFYKSKTRILKPSKDKDGYLRIDLYKDGKSKTFQLHRLIAIEFIPNPENKPEVNHINEDKTKNNIENLEWATHRENINHGTRTQKCSKEVYQYDIEGNLIKKWTSTAECGRNGFTQGIVAACCRGELKAHKNYIWKYAI